MEDMLQAIGLSSQIVLSAIVAIGVFTSLLAVALPAMSGDKLKGRMKAVALERDQIRARERARLASEKERSRGLRQEDNRGIAGLVVEQLNLRKALVDAGFTPEQARITMRPSTPVAVAADAAAEVQKLLERLDDLDDVQDVFHNAELP